MNLPAKPAWVEFTDPLPNVSWGVREGSPRHIRARVRNTRSSIPPHIESATLAPTSVGSSRDRWSRDEHGDDDIWGAWRTPIGSSDTALVAQPNQEARDVPCPAEPSINPAMSEPDFCDLAVRSRRVKRPLARISHQSPACDAYCRESACCAHEQPIAALPESQSDLPCYDEGLLATSQADKEFSSRKPVSLQPLESNVDESESCRLLSSPNHLSALSTSRADSAMKCSP